MVREDRAALERAIGLPDLVKTEVVAVLVGDIGLDRLDPDPQRLWVLGHLGYEIDFPFCCPGDLAME